MKPDRIVDLRSDTVTLPTPEMREAMAHASVGDDVYGEDPTVNRLQEMAASLLGKESGLFLPSGTMGNLVAVLASCGRGDEVILGNLSHTFLFEAGGISALGGVHPHTLPNQPDGTLRIEEIRSAIRSQDVHFPTTRMVILENTHNRCGGVALTQYYTRQVADLAHENGLLLHIDGARIFNAATAMGVHVSQLSSPADSITFCLSKALCAPVGSILCGTKEFISRARRIRKQLGGGMRQAGILAAAGIVALETMAERLVQDHQRAKVLAKGIERIPGINLEPASPATNMIFVQLDEQNGLSARKLADDLFRLGVHVGAVGERRIRMVVHHDIDDESVAYTIRAFGAVLHE